MKAYVYRKQFRGGRWEFWGSDRFGQAWGFENMLAKPQAPRFDDW
jgi:hypothetical protein